MRYMLLMNGIATSGVPGRSVAAQLEATGELVSDEVLAPPEDGWLVRAQQGTPWIVACAAGTERLLSFWVVDCDSRQRALQIAADIAAELNRRPSVAAEQVSLELRPVMRGPGEEM